MDRRRFVISMIELILSAAAFVVVSFAWFALSTETSTGPIEIGISPGYIDISEITYYTKDDVYRFDNDSNTLLVYDENTMTWVLPAYTDPVDAGFSFNGIFINEYDPIISENNTDNIIFLELRLSYQIDAGDSKTLLFDLQSETGLATDSIAEFGFVTSRPYYLSEVTYIQTFVDNSTYVAAAEGTNLFEDLKLDFDDTITYPLTSFYGDTDTYASSYNINQYLTPNPFVVDSTTIDTYIYIKFSYFSTKIENIIDAENVNVSVNGADAIRFFQDIQLFIEEDDNA